MALIESLKPVAGSWRVVGSRWLLYMLAAVPGMLSLSGHLDEKIGTRPWFHEAQLPLDYLSTRLLVSELGEGLAILGGGAAIIWLLQLVWLGGSVQVLDERRPQIQKKVFANGWQYLARFVRIALIALVFTLILQLIVRKVFTGYSATAEIEGWAVYDAYITLNLWRVGVMFFALTLVGILAFWMRMLAVVDERRDTRRLPWAALKLMVRQPISAFVLQFLLIVAVLVVQAIALWSWRQSGNDGTWLMLWALLQLVTAYVWHLRIRLALHTI